MLSDPCDLRASVVPFSFSYASRSLNNRISIMGAIFS